MRYGSFISVLFHAIYRDEDRDIPKNPLLFISQSEFERALEVFLDNGIRFVEPAMLGPGAAVPLDNGAPCVLLTFDDGYHNNLLALEVLARYDVPAVFYLCKEPLERHELFWWDAYFLARSRSVPFDVVYGEIQDLKRLGAQQRRLLMIDRFGTACFTPTLDVHRPMTMEEVTALAAHRCAHIGVHSATHALLDLCSPAAARHELKSAKEFFETHLARELPDMAYPNGNFNDEVTAIARSLGFLRGVTTQPGMNVVRDLDEDPAGLRWLQLKRQMLPVPFSDIPLVDQVAELSAQVAQ